MWKFIVAWVPMIFIAIANGIFREKVLASRLGELQAHQLSTATLILLFALYMWGLFSIWEPASANQTLRIGLLWLLFTVIFEFIFGHYVAGHSWSRLFEDYNILKGRLWIFVLIWVTIAPYIINQLRN
ncbi:hypothetical protein J1N09_02855 [Aureitalea sp. L0-47]|uniref:hypothetical protein n=1 Tax=Aureitalea sp. L0-47 TaxID=2816962 RepID=UPI002238DFD9|nr:hypothetical protein [Aureitalea sp. L0-47]MCW5518761.1 hypothetical protein [Aureitalea sp. L0-47]